MDTTAFDSISLDEIQSVRLMNRVDTKFAINSSLLSEILPSLISGYRILSVDGVTLSSYRTVYLDTSEADMYLLHHNRRKVRQKVRLREYIESGLRWFEVKLKDNHGRMDKKRVALHSLQEFKTSESTHLLESVTPYSVNELVPQLENSFRRITLVNKELTERVTIDMDIAFLNLTTGMSAALNGLVVVEVKQSGYAQSKIINELANRHVRKLNLSKYCIGMALTNSKLKHNNFMKKFRSLRKIATNNQYNAYELGRNVYRYSPSNSRSVL